MQFLGTFFLEIEILSFVENAHSFLSCWSYIIGLGLIHYSAPQDKNLSSEVLKLFGLFLDSHFVCWSPARNISYFGQCNICTNQKQLFLTDILVKKLTILKHIVAF